MVGDHSLSAYMTANLPNLLKNRWSVFALIACVAILLSLFIINSSPVENRRILNTYNRSNNNTRSSGVVFEGNAYLMPNIQEGYVDVFLNTNTPLIGAQIILNLSNVTFNEVAKKDLFVDYATAMKDEGKLYIIANMPPNSTNYVNAGKDLLLARVNLTGLKSTEDVQLVTEESFVLTDNNKVNYLNK
jgi:hypothetical protein